MELINKLLWAITTSIILILGSYFSIKLKFPQLRINKILKSIKIKSSNKITVFDSLMMSLSSRIGVGSIAGIALAIKYGGIGSIFWIWVITIIVSSISYLESLYGSKFKTRERNEVYVGGPHHYLKKIINNNKLAIIYAFLMFISYGIGFITIQTNTVSVVSSISININKHIINIIILLTSIYFIFSTNNKKSDIVSKLVPFMTILYLILGIWIICINKDMTLKIMNDIIIQAFNPTSIKGGFIYSMIVGMQRAIFSTEVAIGTSAISSAMTKTNDNNVGYVQILGNYITTFIICTTTALIILSSNFNDYISSSSNGIELAYHAFNYHFGSIGKIFILIFIILFAYSTIISGFYYGESSLEFITKNRVIKTIYKLIVIIFIFISTYVDATKIWNLIDISVAILCLINLYAIIKIYKKNNN